MYREKKNYLKINPASNLFYGGLLVSSNNSSYNSKRDTIRSLGCILFWAVDKTKKNNTVWGSLDNKINYLGLQVGKYNLLSLPQEVFFITTQLITGYIHPETKMAIMKQWQHYQLMEKRMHL